MWHSPPPAWLCPNAYYGLVTSQEQQALPKVLVQPGQWLCACIPAPAAEPTRVPRGKGYMEARVAREQKGSNSGSIPTQQNNSEPGSLGVGQSNGEG